MPVVATPPSATTKRRRRALDRYLEKLRSLCSGRAAPGDGPSTIDTGEGCVTAEPWVMECVQARFNDESDAPSADADLVTQAVALQLKCTVDSTRLRRLTAPTGKAFYTVQAELMLGTAIGMALLREVQSAINDAVRKGEMERARNFTRFQHDLRTTVANVKKMIAESEQQSAEALSDKLTDQPREMDTLLPRSDRGRTVPNPAEQRLTEMRSAAAARKRAREALAHLPSRTEVLVVLLSVLIAVWLGFVKLPGQFERGRELLTLDNLPALDALVQVDASPPSLYVAVDPEQWARLDERRQRATVSSVSTVLVARGYTGALFRTTEGVPVARWLELTGVHLIEEREHPTTPEEAHNDSLRSLTTTSSSPEN